MRFAQKSALVLLVLALAPQLAIAQTSSGTGDGDVYGDLIRGNVAGRAERVVYERVEVEPAMELSAGSLTAILNKLDGELSAVEALIEQLRCSGYKEEASTWGSRNLRVRTPAAFDVAMAKGKSFVAKLTVLKAQVVRVASYFQDRRQNLDAKAREELTSAFGRVVAVITRYDAAADFAATYRVRYETPMPFDEKYAALEKDGRGHIRFPKMPAAFVSGHETVEASVQDVSDGSGNRLRRVKQKVERTVVAPTMVTSGKSVAAASEEARKLLDQAQEARTAIESPGTVESSRVTFSDEAAYDKLVPTAVRFQTLMVRALAHLNSIAAAIEGAGAQLTNADVRGVIAELNTRRQDLTRWGTSKSFRFNTIAPFNERLFYLLPLEFPGDLAYRGPLPPRSSGSGDGSAMAQDFGRGTGDGNLTPGLGTGGTGHGHGATMSSEGLLALVRGSGSTSARESVLIQNLDLVNDLTPQTLVEAARWLSDSSAKLRVFNAGLDVIRRRLQGYQSPAASPVRSSELIELARYLGSSSAKEQLFTGNLDLVSDVDSSSLIEMGRYLGSTQSKLTLYGAGFQQLRLRSSRSNFGSPWPLTTDQLYEMGRYLGSTSAKEELFVSGMGLVSDLTPQSLEKLNAQLGSTDARSRVINAGLDEIYRHPRFGR